MCMHVHASLPPFQVFILPTIRINGAQYRGKMATAEVLRAICAGFAAGNTPQACSKVGAAGGGQQVEPGERSASTLPFLPVVLRYPRPTVHRRHHGAGCR